MAAGTCETRARGFPTPAEQNNFLHMNLTTRSLKHRLQGCASLLALLCAPCAWAQTAAPGTSLAGKYLLVDYSEAEMAETSIDSPNAVYKKALKPGAHAIVTDIGTFAPVRRLKTFNARQEGECATSASIVKCEPMEGGAVRVTIIAVAIRNNADALNIANIVNAIDSLTLEQIHEKVREIELDSTDSLVLTFQSPDRATATGSYASGDCEVMYRNIRVSVETGATPDPVQPDAGGAAAPEPEEDDAPIPMDNARSIQHRVFYFTSELEDMAARDSTMQLYKKRLLTLLPLIADELNPNITLPETKGNTALHYACGIGNYELVEWLLSIGADPNKRTNKGASPLQCVGGKSATAIRNLLIKHGARK